MSSKKSPIDNFMKHVSPKQSNGCWVWTGCSYPAGYGKFTIVGDKTYLAHRFSYQHFNNLLLEETECVLHKCDNPPCVNPDHLWLGTNKDNSQDMVQKGRAPKGAKHSPESYWKEDGTSVHALIRECDVIEILTSSERHKDISKRLGVSYDNVQLIRSGKNWKHLQHLNTNSWPKRKTNV